MVKNKYGAKSNIYDGIRFSSIVERDFYKYLANSFGKENIKVHPRFLIIPGEKVGKIKHRARFYTADFECMNVVYDVKGQKIDAAASLRIRMFTHVYDRGVVIVRRSGNSFKFEDFK